MKKLHYISVQPRLLYYAWQVEVMINNFIQNGINPKDIHIIVSYKSDNLTNKEQNVIAWKKLYKKYKSVNFYEYEDTRPQPILYVSSLRPNALKQHFEKYPELKNEVIFYHDCDILFTKPPDFSKFLEDDIWYLSNTNSYINYDYIKSKSYGIYESMCKIVGIDEEIPKKYNEHSGGAQYIMKGLTPEYWHKVERDSEQLLHQITQKSIKIKELIPSYHELQIWCADMWAVLWNAWLFGHETKVVSELNFAWATDNILFWDDYPIYHNAGVVGEDYLFNKTLYINSYPSDIDLEKLNNGYCSYKYAEIVKNICENISYNADLRTDSIS